MSFLEEGYFDKNLYEVFPVLFFNAFFMVLFLKLNSFQSLLFIFRLQEHLLEFSLLEGIQQVTLKFELQYYQRIIRNSIFIINFLYQFQVSILIQQQMLEFQHNLDKFDEHKFHIFLNYIIFTFIRMKCNYPSYSYILLKSRHYYLILFIHIINI